MAEALETIIQGVKDLNQEMEKLRTDINKITAKGSNDALVTEIANLNERISSLEQKSMSLSRAWPMWLPSLKD